MADTAKVKERAKTTASKVAGSVPEKVGQVSGKAGGKVREQLTARSTQAGDQISSLSEALRTTAQQLRSEDKGGVAKITEQAAKRIDQVADYLRRSDADTILADIEEAGSRRPWAVIVVGVSAGFAGSRFLKASSSRRHEAKSSGVTSPATPPESLAPDTVVVPFLPEDSPGPVPVTPPGGVA